MKNRDEIINALEYGLKSNNKIYAFWLEGSDGNNTVDEYSDLDFWIDVEDNYLQECILLVEDILNRISTIDFKYDMKHKHPKIEQKIYHLKKTSKFLMIDLCWQLHSREKQYFTKNDKIENAKVIFDKAKVIGFKEEQIDKNTEKICEIKEKTQYCLSQDIRILKYVNRKQYLEALYHYNEYVIFSLVEFLRGIYTPSYTNYEMVHISNHLPKKYVDTLTYFCQISSIKDIEKKTKEAKSWFDELMKVHSDIL